MEKIELKDAFAEFKNQKNIDRPTMMGVLEDVFRTQITKTYGSADNFDIIINIDKGDCEIYWNREVVEEVEDPNTQIALEDLEDDDYEPMVLPNSIPRPPVRSTKKRTSVSTARRSCRLRSSPASSPFSIRRPAPTLRRVRFPARARSAR